MVLPIEVRGVTHWIMANGTYCFGYSGSPTNRFDGPAQVHATGNECYFTGGGRHGLNVQIKEDGRVYSMKNGDQWIAL